MLNHFSRDRLFVTLWAVALQALLSMGFSRQEYWSGLSFPSPGDLPDPGIEPASLMSPALAGGLLLLAPAWKPHFIFGRFGSLEFTRNGLISPKLMNLCVYSLQCWLIFLIP